MINKEEEKKLQQTFSISKFSPNKINLFHYQCNPVVFIWYYLFMFDFFFFFFPRCMVEQHGNLIIENTGDLSPNN